MNRTLELATGWTGLDSKGIPVGDDDAVVVPFTLLTLVGGRVLYLSTHWLVARRKL